MLQQKAISFDFWGTLCVSNPAFKERQSELAHEFTGVDKKEWLAHKARLKKEIDNFVETTGSHPERKHYYKLLMPGLSCNGVDDFIKYSDRLFINFPPKLREPKTKIIEILRDQGVKSYISSNTVFIYGDVLKEFIYSNFGIIKMNCKFSDEVGCSKPAKEMFNFPIKPIWHIGDNLITDGACENYGIKHYHINQEQTFQTFLTNENI